MFYQPRFSYSPFASAPSHFHTNHPHLHPSFDDISSYDSYDAHRSALEAQALARQQQARRNAEQAALERQHAQQLRQQQYEAALEVIRQREVEVARRQQEARRRAAYEAAVRAEVERRREAYAAQLEYQRRVELQRRARLQAVQEQRKRALAAEQQRYVAAAAAEGEDVFDLGAFVQHLLESAFDDTSASTTTTLSAPASSPTPSKPVEAAPSPAPKPAAVDETPSHPFDIFAQILDAFVPTLTTTSDSTPAPAESTSAPPAASTSTSTPTAPAPSPAEESAATTLQRRFRNHLFRKQQLSTISSLTSTFDSHISAFTLPTSLTFTDATSPKLAYSADNKPFHAHEDFLVALLSQIDEVASKGDRVVKTARKQLVRKVEEELTRLDDKKAEEFEKFKSASEGKGKDKMVDDDAAPESTTTSTIDPPEVPLPTAAATTTNSSTSIPLTLESLANIPSAPFKRGTLSHRSDSTHSTDVSTLGDYEVSRTIQEVLDAAQKLGEEVFASEEKEREELE
ncbi:hypothetical protein MNV49_005674 [Pseudohyphozyma bogoriensis]|nr:hypothetical protein MNV49_005674 [Pseudohyphozyma bogoriensis]